MTILPSKIKSKIKGEIKSIDGGMVQIKNFRAISALLEKADELLVEHQIALIEQRYEDSMELFEILFNFRITHMKIIKEQVIPLYEKYITNYPPGAKPLYFIRETTRIEKDFLEQRKFLNSVYLEDKMQEIKLVNWLEKQWATKDILDHHDAREKVFLFPIIDSEVAQELYKPILQKYLSKIEEFVKVVGV